MPTDRLEKQIWIQRAAEHRVAIQRWTEPFRARRRIGQSHPIHDFLFVYYQYSPAKLEQWHPGIDVRLNETNHAELPYPEYRFHDDESAECDPACIDDRELSRLQWIVELLTQTQSRRGNYSCFGLHEWAMVYRGEEIRHAESTGMRLPQKDIDETVESRPLTCTHFDAFRFFADSAKPLNRITPELESRIEMEQPGCIHANMDLYKWAFKAMPWIGSDLLRECFELAMEARAIDMRASPYDLKHYENYPPIRIETAEGRVQYESLQRSIAEKAAPLRGRLIAKIESVVKAATAAKATPSRVE